MAKKLKPGQRAPRSGLYREEGPRGGKRGQVTVVKDEPMPPTKTKGSSFRLERPADNKSGKEVEGLMSIEAEVIDRMKQALSKLGNLYRMDHATREPP